MFKSLATAGSIWSGSVGLLVASYGLTGLAVAAVLTVAGVVLGLGLAYASHMLSND